MLGGGNPTCPSSSLGRSSPPGGLRNESQAGRVRSADSADVVGVTILHDVASGVSTITLNRPEAANALLPEMRDAIIELLGAAETDPAVRAVAIRANGRHFCAGADVSSIAGGGPPLVGDGMRRIIHGAQRLVTAVLDCPKPVVAVVEGAAAGLGAHLAYACDMVVATEEATFLEPFLLRGIIVDAGGAYLLPRLVGMQRAKELMFLGERLSAAGARDLGLVNRVVPATELDSVASELLTKLAAMPTGALSFTKRLVNASFDHDRATSLLMEASFQELQSSADDAKEGVAAFLERRPPGFQGH
jgi:2-(1,2-epoxy-1,2-dihydrophenyl)acetyl-CoA isomerase